MSPRFFALMKREWLQHRLGWLVLTLVPVALLVLLAVLDGRGIVLQVGGEGTPVPALRDWPPVLHTLLGTLAAGLLTGLLAIGSALIQLPGLARRDTEDRSIEFWRALPTSHAENVGAMLLMHLLVLPALAVSVAVLAAQLLASALVLHHQGLAAWAQQPWGTLAAWLALMIGRFWLGLVLAMAWLSPLLLGLMVAAVWLRRWALPVAAAVAALGVQVLDGWLPVPVFRPVLTRLSSEAVDALVTDLGFAVMARRGVLSLADDLPQMLGRVLADTWSVLRDAASPAFAVAVLAGAACFGVLVLQRRQAA